MSHKVTPDDLIRDLSATLDPAFARAVVESYTELEQRFLANDWGPAELNGGRLCEAASRCLLQLDTGRITHTDLPGAIRRVLLDEIKPPVPHHALDPKDRRHITRVVEMVYNFRSDRGAVHISPLYTANGMDAMLVLHAGKWIFAEVLRLAWNADRLVVGEVIAQLVQLEHAVIHELEGRPLVLSEDATAPDEILVLLNSVPGHRLSRDALCAYAYTQKPKTVRAAVTRLINEKDIRPVDGTAGVALTPKGQQRVREEIVPKLRRTS